MGAGLPAAIAGASMDKIVTDTAKNFFIHPPCFELISGRRPHVILLKATMLKYPFAVIL
jgi:hypothetical protein